VLATVKDGVSEDQLAPLLRAEAARVWELYTAGVVRSIHYREDVAGAVLLLEAAAPKEAAQAAESLPLAQAGLLAVQVIPLSPYTGFEQLFQG
jgi:hypothetical protein